MKTLKKYVSIFPNNDKTYLQNAMFDVRRNKGVEIPIFANLKKFLKSKKIQINTYDISTMKTSYKYIYRDLPDFIPSNFLAWKMIFLNRKKNILICIEPPIVIPFNYMKLFHFFFAKIYTWNDDFVDNKKYFKIHLPKSSLNIRTHPKKFQDKKFLVLINSNKSLFYPFKLLSRFGKELYSERIKAIEFFERNLPNRFFLYGMGWNKPKKYNLKESILGFNKYTTYKGKIDDKIRILSGFKYCLCFENLTEAKGFITEKIFDCLKAKCIPIYWGASDIEKYIPKNCFIDFRDFYDYDKLIIYLDSISESKYNSYIRNIEILLSSKKFVDKWFEDGFAHFFLEDILEERCNEK